MHSGPESVKTLKNSKMKILVRKSKSFVCCGKFIGISDYIWSWIHYLRFVKLNVIWDAKNFLLFWHRYIFHNYICIHATIWKIANCVFMLQRKLLLRIISEIWGFHSSDCHVVWQVLMCCNALTLNMPEALLKHCVDSLQDTKSSRRC